MTIQKDIQITSKVLFFKIRAHFFHRIYNPYLSFRKCLYTLTQTAAAAFLMSYFLERQSAYSIYDDDEKFSTASCIPVIIFLVRNDNIVQKKKEIFSRCIQR